MLFPRIIPFLLIQNNALVKTIRFTNAKYVGDPINAVRIFNEKEVDEIVILDIDATSKNREPNYNLIDKIAQECRMPMCYGGGINNVAQLEKIFSLGVEKIAISTAAIKSPNIIKIFSNIVGSQSVVVVLDVRLVNGKYQIFINNGKTQLEINLNEFLLRIQDLGAGEIVINDIDRDGTMSGYNLDLVNSIRNIIDIPFTLVGGAGSLKDIGDLIKHNDNIGSGAGSLFIFKGKFRAVLISYPTYNEKYEILKNNYNLFCGK
jgi:cyclase